MWRMRSLPLPKLSTSKAQDEENGRMKGTASPYHHAPGHSRSSSGASSTSSPTFSNRSHSRWPSSNSSLITTPDSPVSVARPALHDLVEEPAERDEFPAYYESAEVEDEPLCICDTPFCEHRRIEVSQSAVLRASTSEWTPSDEKPNDDDFAAVPSIKRRRSDEASGDIVTMRSARHWPSISKRWRERKATTSMSSPTIRSAPPSRSSSARLPFVRQSLATHLGPREAVTPPVTPAETSRSHSIRGEALVARLGRSQSNDMQIPDPNGDPIDREEHSSTPLLPPLMCALQSSSNENLQSPLQSPSVASPSTTTSGPNTPLSTPVIPGMLTPPLSAKASFASSVMGRSHHIPHSSADNPPPAIAEELDLWAIKLGHANFHITPQPYIPGICDQKSCNRLLEDWETARVEYMRQAAHVSEHYGPTSQTYKYTQQKWAEIDVQWRNNLDEANAIAQASGEVPTMQSLAETEPLSRMPSFKDAQQSAKFPAIDDDEIVGPMVRYAKIQRRPSSKKNPFLKLFTDPASLLGGRSPFGTGQ